MSADLAGSLWIIIVVVYLIAVFIGAVRRAFRGAQRLSPSERYAEAKTEVDAAKQAGTQIYQKAAADVAQMKSAAADAASTYGTTPAATSQSAVQPERQVLVDVLAQVLKSQTMGKSVPPGAASPGAVSFSPGALVRIPLVPSMLLPGSSLPGVALPGAYVPATMEQQGADFSAASMIPASDRSRDTQPTLALDLPTLVRRLASPSGLAFAVIASTIIDTPPSLRTQPRDPGGW
jgi:hypothetical protein